MILHSTTLLSLSQAAQGGQWQEDSTHDELIRNIITRPQVKSFSLCSIMKRMQVEEEYGNSAFKADEEWLTEISFGDLEKNNGYERILRLFNEGYFQRDECKGENTELNRLLDLMLNDRLAMFYAGLANQPEEGIAMSGRLIDSFCHFVQLVCDQESQILEPSECEETFLIAAHLKNHFEIKAELAKGLNLLLMNDFEGAKQAFTALGSKPELSFDQILLLKILEQRLGQQFFPNEPFLIDTVPKRERALWLFKMGDYANALKEIENCQNDRFHPYVEYESEIKTFSYAFLGQAKSSMGSCLDEPLIYYISRDEDKAKESLDRLPVNYKNLNKLAPFLLLMKAVAQFERHH